jgi:hypothetical protein
LKTLCENTYGSGLTGKVYDGYGVWDVDLTREAQLKLYPSNASEYQTLAENIDPRDVEKLRDSPKRRWELACLAFYLNHERRVQDILENQTLEKNERIRSFILSVRKIGVLLEYCELD